MLRSLLLAVAAALLVASASGATVRTVTNTNDAGAGSLREAISAATDGDEVRFAIAGEGPFTISPVTALPGIAAGVLIDGGASCATWPPTLQIEIDGSNTPPGTVGLVVAGAGVTVRGLVVNSYQGNAIRVDAADATFECNFIGTDVGGTQDFGNGGSGIVLEGATGAQIGGSTASQRNLISANTGSGVVLRGGASGNRIEGNYIGCNVTNGASLPNQGAGVFVESGSSNTIGDIGSGNVLRANGGGAAVVTGSGSGGNSIRGNSALENGSNGIDLVGAFNEDPNDFLELDADTGPNRLQNWPELDDVGYASGSNEITAIFYVPTAPANATYPLAIDFYRADVDDEEGEVYLGTVSYGEADFATGSVTKSFVAQGAIAIGQNVVATATDAGGNTSEFADDFATVPEPGALAAAVAALSLAAIKSSARRGRPRQALAGNDRS